MESSNVEMILLNHITYSFYLFMPPQGSNKSTCIHTKKSSIQIPGNTISSGIGIYTANWAQVNVIKSPLQPKIASLMRI